MNHSLVVEVVNKYQWLTISGNIIKFCWVPGQVGIKGNEAAVAAANAPLTKCQTAKSHFPMLNSTWMWPKQWWPKQ